MKAYMTQADLDNDNFPATDFHTYDYQSKITSIITKNDNIVPATATESWDISEAGDGSVMAYVEDDGTGNSTYKVTIGGKGGIIANESMIDYFGEFRNVTSIDLSALDTSEVTDMSIMFARCSILTSLDLSKFDTSKVTNMRAMFSKCSSLTSLDVSKFDTSQVTDMSVMFWNCKSLTSLDVSKFDTSKVPDMNSMFCNCPAWDAVDKTKFAGANVCHLS